ncbi:L-fuconolactonase [Aliiruegeria haliotis]|uniref:L-fuconolactonase n=1 Tax=Aliiruegeria haliotis TaxID=1280846 RepID=A0A2T0RMS7_9RHOB|nr:amidohydrolase family protein [Aliiruegeria haliotis]PRY22489.1 L-fuconolactonase [Aliiruegeria haliotis]
MIIDAHQHFWQLDRGVYDWIDDSIAGLRRDFLPHHLEPYLKPLGIDGTILVQASETVTENEFLLNTAEASGCVRGIVAWLDLAAPNAVSELERLSEIPLVKGVRPVLQGIEDTNWVLRREVLEALRHLPGLGLRFDALIVPRHLTAIAELADRLPDLSIVVDHAAKPIIANRARPDAHWKHGMARLAGIDSIHCKISGIAFEQGRGWTTAGLQPVADHLLETFGPHRLMWGSDWPVLEHVGSYIQWFDSVNQMISGCDARGRAAILGETATAFYDLETT